VLPESVEEDGVFEGAALAPKVPHQLKLAFQQTYEPMTHQSLNGPGEEILRSKVLIPKQYPMGEVQDITVYNGNQVGNNGRTRLESLGCQELLEDGCPYCH
jgi:nucleotidyltransferase/DNA polymerase involved in DNA repair